MKSGFTRIELHNSVWEVPQKYQNLIEVGEGAYSQVCAAFDTKCNLNVAIKKLSWSFISNDCAKRTYREFKLLKYMKHENVISLLDVFTPSTSLDEFQDVYLVTHLMDEDLKSLIINKKFTGDHIKTIVYQILLGLKFIHSAGIIHRDLKPSNIAVNKKCEIKILDFGSARLTEEENKCKLVKPCDETRKVTSQNGGYQKQNSPHNFDDKSLPLTLMAYYYERFNQYHTWRWYRAPEIMFNWMSNNFKVDIWSVGCIMAELILSETLFKGNDEIDQLLRIMALCGTPDDELIEKILSKEARNFIRTFPIMKKKNFREVFKGASNEAIDLLEKMLNLDADKRPTAHVALMHPYFAQFDGYDDKITAGRYVEPFNDKKITIKDWKIMEACLQFMNKIIELNNMIDISQ